MRNDLTGQRFGRLIVVRRAGVAKDRHVLWECQCECGNTTVVMGKCLKNGDTRSCGCLLNEVIAKGGGAYKHGGSPTKNKPNRLYGIWAGMLNRCYNRNNKAYSYYGGRGITVCKEWKNDFTAFRGWATSNGYCEDLTIDRIDNDGDYRPENCRWVTMKEQNSNKRSSLLLTYDDETHTITEWAKIKGITKWTLVWRIRNGWSIEKALGTNKRR